MKVSPTLRRVTRATAPVSAIALAVLVACIDLPSTPAPVDDWADGAAVSAQLQAQLFPIGPVNPTPVSIGPIQTSLPVLRNIPSGDGSTPSFNRSGRGSTAVRHFRHGKDSVTSFALYFDKPNAPPKFLYIFENARIRAIVSPTYARRGSGHVRTKSRVTLFSSDGEPEYQANVGSEIAAGAPATSVPRDATHTASLDIQEADVPAPCTSLWISYSIAATLLAAASATLSTTSAACATLIMCPAAAAASVAWLAALDKWQVALDKLTDCILANQLAATPPPGGTGNPDERTPRPDAENEWNDASMTSTVEDFIDNAIANGNYYCTSTSCVYYAS